MDSSFGTLAGRAIAMAEGLPAISFATPMPAFAPFRRTASLIP